MSIYTIKSSPNYEKQKEEIELLKNIIPEKITILKEEPNFHIQFEIEGNTTEEKKIKKFILIIYLNNFYPEKSPRFTIYEVNNNFSEKSKIKIENKLKKYCKDNLGIQVIYNLYEICQEFVDEEEKIAQLKKKEKENKEKKNAIPYQLYFLNKIKTIDEFVNDIIILKNGNILIVKHKIKIYDNKFENILFEKLKVDASNNILFYKYFPSPSLKQRDFLYIFTYKEVLVYEICYLSEKKIYENYIIKINGNTIINLIEKIDNMSDVIEFPQFVNSVFFINNKDKNNILHKYDKIKNNKNLTELNFDKKILKNNYNEIFRKIYQINSEKFIIASYTIKKVEHNGFSSIEGFNKLIFVESNNFKFGKTHNIKISPLKNSMTNYKNNYIIVSYFNTIDKKKKNLKNNKKEEPHYDFEDNPFCVMPDCCHHNTEYYRDYYYYSYDITDHYIGIFDIKYEELINIIEFDFVKIMYNINDYLLCLFTKKENNNKNDQINVEFAFHLYYNEFMMEKLIKTNLNLNLKNVNYFGYLLLDKEIKVFQDNIDNNNILFFKEINKGCLAIAYNKKGLILYNNK